MSEHKIPKTDSIQALAEFWDSHDLTDFEDQLEEVDEPIFERETVININLNPEEFEAVQEIANIKDMSYSDLMREWILEKIYNFQDLVEDVSATAIEESQSKEFSLEKLRKLQKQIGTDIKASTTNFESQSEVKK